MFILYPPGTRKRNKVYYAIIYVGGRQREVSTKTRDPRRAREFAKRAEERFYDSDVLGGGKTQTVGAAIAAYIAWRRPSKNDEHYLDILRKWFAAKPLTDMDQNAIDQAARALYPGRTPETWNRQVYTPISAALKHAGVEMRIRRPKQAKPRHKALTRAQAEILIANAGDELAALLTLLFFSGVRISEAMSLTPDRLDLPNARACFNVSKKGEDHWRPLHHRVVAALANLPERKDRLFRWRNRFGPRREMAALCAKTGIRFHPHMARHSFATWLTEEGSSLRDIMDAGGWEDYKSVLRYTRPDEERVRRAINRL